MSTWKANFCSCFEIFPVWAMSCICPCIVQGVSIWELNQEGGCAECLMSAFCFSVGLALNRTRIREKYSIKGNIIADCCCYSCGCHSCMATQEYLQTAEIYKSPKF